MNHNAEVLYAVKGSTSLEFRGLAISLERNKFKINDNPFPLLAFFLFIFSYGIPLHFLVNLQKEMNHPIPTPIWANTVDNIKY